MTPVLIPYFWNREGMEIDDLLCLRNARPPKDGRGSLAVLLARGTRTIGMGSFDARNRGTTRLPLKVKWGIGTTRAVEDRSVPIPKDGNEQTWREHLQSRSTAAVGPTRVPFQEREASELEGHYCIEDIRLVDGRVGREQHGLSGLEKGATNLRVSFFRRKMM